MRRFNRLGFLTLAWTLLAGSAGAQPIHDPVGDFIPTYVGPHNPDLDVVNGAVIFAGNGFLFQATMDGDIGDHSVTLGRYVWGVDRGQGNETRNFAQLGLPDIIFDAVVAVSPGDVSIVNDIVTDVATPLPPENIVVLDKTILVWVPLSMLPSYVGRPPQEYTWNLWPRWDGIPMSDEQISDFAPDDHNASVVVVR